MTRILSIDPGMNTGISLGYFDATTPFQLLERWQVHGGLQGFIRWWERERPKFDELLSEKFILGDDEFRADLTPVLIEGAIQTLYRGSILWQPRTDKAGLIGYPPSAKTKAQRQRVRFDFLERFGMFRAGIENDDSNDTIVHSLVSLKRRRHMPTLRAYFGPRSGLTLAA